MLRNSNRTLNQQCQQLVCFYEHTLIPEETVTAEVDVTKKKRFGTQYLIEKNNVNQNLLLGNKKKLDEILKNKKEIKMTIQEYNWSNFGLCKRGLLQF